MKIYELKSENFKKLSVELILDGKGVVIKGKNGVGKSTFIDAIYTTLTGKEIPDNPIRIGKDKAKNTVKIKEDDGNIIIVERMFSGDKTTLTVKTGSGAKYSSPQKFLNETIGNISFDPFEFINKPPREQKRFLMDLLKIDFTEIDKKKTELLAQKDSAIKLWQSFKQQLSEIPFYKEIKVLEQKNTGDLLDKLQTASDLQTKLNSLLSDIDGLKQQNLFLEQRNYEIDDEIKRLQAERQDNDIRRGSMNVEIEKKAVESKSIIIPDTSNIHAERKEIEDYNEKVRTNIAYNKKSEELKEVENKGFELSDNIKKLEDERIKIIKDAKMPIDNLDFTDDGLLYGGLPLNENQLSKAKLVEIGLKISMALNPKLRIMRIKDGSLLDSEMLAVIRNSCKQNDYQLFLEKVSDDSEIGFVIEESEGQ